VRTKFIGFEASKRDFWRKMRALEEKNPHLKRDKFLWNIHALEEIRKDVISDPGIRKGTGMEWDTMERVYGVDFGWPYGPSGDELIRWRREWKVYFPGIQFHGGFGPTFLRLPGEE